MQNPSDISDILDFYAQTNTAYLHARGAHATRLLAKKVAGRPGEKILEFGFGTGSTTAHLAAAFPGADFYGVDVSAQMYQKAQSRLRFCGLAHRCRLFWVRPGERLPFDDGFFDTVFVESVLAMQPGETLAFAVAEISRLLKPGGKFVANETIWLDSATPAEIEQFNRACVEKFGVIQANGRYPYRSHWIDLLEKHQIRTDSWHSLDELDQEQGIAPHGWAPRLSALFTFWGRLKAKLLPRYRNIQLRYDREEAVFYGGKKYMAGILMSGVKV